MTFVLDCPACRKAVSATPELVGRVMACPHCGAHFTLPAVGAAPELRESGARSMDTIPRGAQYTFSCSRCASILEARGDLAGRSGRCPTCGATFRIPEYDPRTGLAIGPAEVTDDGQLPTPMHAYATAGSKAPKIETGADGELAIRCPRCSRLMPIDADSCNACGIPFTMEGAAAVSRPHDGSNTHATAALTLGVVGMLCTLIPIVGQAVAVAAIGLGISGMARATEAGQSRPGYGLAVAGIVLGGLSLAAAGYYFFL